MFFSPLHERHASKLVYRDYNEAEASDTVLKRSHSIRLLCAKSLVTNFEGGGVGGGGGVLSRSQDLTPNSGFGADLVQTHSSPQAKILIDLAAQTGQTCWKIRFSTFTRHQMLKFPPAGALIRSEGFYLSIISVFTSSQISKFPLLGRGRGGVHEYQ